jgi:uncharacterized membrane protein
MRTALVLLALLVPGVALASSGEEEEVTNEFCPVMEGTPVSEDLYLDYRGVRVHFCCESCVTDFRNDPEKYVPLLPEKLRARMISVEEWKADGGWKQKTAAEKHPYGVVHPIMVHFPIALTAVAALAGLLSLLVARSFFRNAATFCIVIAAVMTVPSTMTGGEAEEAKGVMSDALHERVEAHEETASIAQWVVIGAAVLTLLSLAGPLARTPWFRYVAVAALLAAAGIIGYTGYLGGEVMRGPDHLKNILPF